MIRYAPVEALDCISRHRDLHGDRMRGRCRECHQTGRWNRVERSRVESTFDHETTGFPWVGAHTAIQCRACHSPTPTAEKRVHLEFPSGAAGRSYPTPEHETCTSHHQGFREGVLADRSCDVCHGPDSWVPLITIEPNTRWKSGSDLDFDHMTTRFPFEGAHADVPCGEFHLAGEEPGGQQMIRYRPLDLTCTACHEGEG